MHIGYFGVILPDKKQWQGFFLDDTFKEATDRYLTGMRAEPPGEVGGPVPPEVPEGACLPPFTGFIAGLASGIARMTRDFKGNPAGLAVVGLAFSRLTGLRYFIIVSSRDPRGGEMTHLEDMPKVKSEADARASLGTHPLVVGWKREMFEDELARMGMRRKPGDA